MMNDKNGPYEVGYGKPPLHTRFKPGQSGNPKGKPRGAKNLATIVNNAIKERVVVTEKGKRKSASKLEIAVTQLVNKAVMGDHKAMTQLLPLVQIIEGRAEADAASTPILADVDNMMMANIGERIKQSLLREAANRRQLKKRITNEKEEKS
ncbi:MAG: DUF5681 domain-containing protein [Syntrophales bacterium]|jgi:hypothetical protein